MLVIPAMDVEKGRVVTGTHNGTLGGAFVSDMPIETLKAFEADGAEVVSIFDLNAYRNDGNNDIMLAYAKRQTGLRMHVCGGARSMLRTKELIELIGRDRARVGISSQSASDPDFMMELGDAILYKENSMTRNNMALFIDIVDGRMLSEGMVKEYCPIEFANMRKNAFGYVAFRDVGREFRMSGIDEEFFRTATREINYPVLAAGGVGSIDDIKRLRDTGAYGAIVGKALYEGKFLLKDAIEAVGPPGEYE